jgi:alpha-L-fucosidase
MAKRLSAEEKDRARRMKWWHEAKFGMFIHWGLYGILGRHEWAMDAEAIPVAEYEPLARQFKPKPNAARAWAKLAKQAGMKYMVMTTKHHEGFCLWDTATTDYCAPKQACGRDLAAEYVRAARAEGLRVGFYFSLMDWHHPDGEKCAVDEQARKRFIKYVHEQVRELCSNYGKIDILWYDVPAPLADAKLWESAKMNRMVRKLQPDIIINNRSRLPEDFSTPEQKIVAEAGGRAWESCMTMNDSWGYNANDDAWKSPKRIVLNLMICAHDGGNYLLNIGPKLDGSVPQPSVQILREVGRWMKTYGRAIYGTEKNTIRGTPCVGLTSKGKKLHAICYYWPGKRWSLAGITGKVKSVRLLPGGRRIKFRQSRLRLLFEDCPSKAPDPLVSVLEIRCASRPGQIPRDKVRALKKREKVNVSF